MKKCKCKACNPKYKKIKTAVPKGYNWIGTEKSGNKIVTIFVKTIK